MGQKIEHIIFVINACTRIKNISDRIITSALIKWLSNLAIFWVCDWDLGVCVLVFSEARTIGVCPSFLTHIECMQRVVVKTHIQYEYMHTHIIWHPLSALSPVTSCWTQDYSAYKYYNYMNFSTHLIFICESWYNFFK